MTGFNAFHSGSAYSVNLELRWERRSALSERDLWMLTTQNYRESGWKWWIEWNHTLAMLFYQREENYFKTETSYLHYKISALAATSYTSSYRPNWSDRSQVGQKPYPVI